MTSRGNGVTLRDVYDIVERLETKMDKRLTETEKEVDDLQGFRNKAMAIIGVAATFSSVFATWLWNQVIGRN